MTDEIDTATRCRLALRRLDALNKYRAALRAVQAQAAADRQAGILKAEDLRDLVALDDVLDDLGYTSRELENSIADWETTLSYGGPDDPAADRSWYHRRTL